MSSQQIREPLVGAEDRLATYVVLPDDRSAIQASAVEVEELLTVLRVWSISSSEDEEQAAALMKEAHERHKALEKRRKDIVAPALEAQKTINDLFRPALVGWDEAKGITKRLLTEAAARREAERRVQLAAAAAEAATGNTAVLQQVEAPRPPPQGVAHRDEIEIKILDIDVVPREYLCVDWSKLKIAARNGLSAPEGVEFVRKTKVQVGR